MGISMKKLQTLWKKDFSDYLKNPTLLVTLILPIAFVLFFKMIQIPVDDVISLPDYLLLLGVIMNTVMSGLMIASTSIAEEKEKFTLRTLMLSNVNAMEFFLAKILVAFFVTELGNVVIFFLAEIPISYLLTFFLFTLLGSLCTIMLSCVIGIISRDQKSCGTLQIPIMLIFMLPTFFGNLNKFMEWIAKITPLHSMMILYYRDREGNLFSKGSIWYFSVLLVWIVLSTVLFYIIYKKKGRDN